MTKPVRIQRKRTKGWRMPPNTVYVGRPTVFGNPWAVTDHGMTLIHTSDGRGKVNLPKTAIMTTTTEDAVKRFRAWLSGAIYNWNYVAMLPVEAWRTSLIEQLPNLHGKNLACWCPLDKPCHADVLLELANAEPGA